MKRNTKLILIGSISKINFELLNHLSLNFPDIYIGPETGIFSHPILWQNFEKFKKISIDTNFFNIEEKDLNKIIINGINPFCYLLNDQLGKYNISNKDILKLISISNNVNELIDNYRNFLCINDNQIWIETSYQNIFSMLGYYEFFKSKNKYIIYKPENISISKYLYSKKNISKQFYSYFYWSLASYYQIVRNHKKDFHFINEKDLKNGFKESNKIIKSYGVAYYKNTSLKSSKIKVSKLNKNSKNIYLENLINSINRFSKFKVEVLKEMINLHYYSQNENFSINKVYKINILKKPLSYFIEYKIISLINLSIFFDFFYFKKEKNVYDLNKIIIALAKERLIIFLKKIIYYAIRLHKVCFFICKKFIRKTYLIAKIFLNPYRLFIRKTYFIAKSFLNPYRLFIRKIYFIAKSFLNLYRLFIRKTYFIAKSFLNLYGLFIRKTYFIAKIFLDIYRLFINKYELIFKNKFKFVNKLSKNYDRDIVVCTATDGRFNLIELQAKEIEALIQDSNLTIEYCIAISTIDDFTKAEELKTKYTFINIELCQNKPLGYKWQSIINYVKNRYKPKSLFISGSDDFLTSKYILNMSMQIENIVGSKFPVVMPYYWKIFDEQSKNFYNLSYTPDQNIPLGAGRVYSYGFLIICKWRIFDFYKNSLLDDKAYYVAKKNKVFVNIIKPNFNQGSIISIKSETRKELNTLKNILHANTIEYKKLNKIEINNLLMEINSPFCRDFFKKR